ncbi:MAG: WGR domain-containing protein [Chthoniobacteraceae bacterium]
MENTTLYFKQGSSDKVYQAAIQPSGDQFIVTFAYGRRGATLTTGTKTQAPVNYADAKSIYDKLIREKTAKGYTPGEDGTPYQHTEKANQTSGILPQLLNAVNEEEVEDLLADSNYWMQEKHDGRRLLVRKRGDEITGINKLGLFVALPASLIACVSDCPDDFILDGEAIGDMLCAFDALLIGYRDIRGLPYSERHVRLLNLLSSFGHPAIHAVETACLAKEKAEMFARLKLENREGVVFKHTDAPYIAGRPASDGPQRKFKFHATASFVVGKINAKRSVSLFLYAGNNLKHAGNVTIPPNHSVPEKDQIVECRYLYAYRESGCIYQPVYLGARDDIRPAECTVDQLKYKSEPQQSAA